MRQSANPAATTWLDPAGLGAKDQSGLSPDREHPQRKHPCVAHSLRHKSGAWRDNFHEGPGQFSGRRSEKGAIRQKTLRQRTEETNASRHRRRQGVVSCRSIHAAMKQQGQNLRPRLSKSDRAFLARLQSSLRSFRQCLHLSLIDLATGTRWPPSVFAAVEHGRALPSVTMLAVWLSRLVSLGVAFDRQASRLILLRFRKISARRRHVHPSKRQAK